MTLFSFFSRRELQNFSVSKVKVMITCTEKLPSHTPSPLDLYACHTHHLSKNLTQITKSLAVIYLPLSTYGKLYLQTTFFRFHINFIIKVSQQLQKLIL